MLSGNLHGGTVVASYPFDDSASHQQEGHYSQSEDDSLFRYLALVYSSNHPVMKTGQPNCPEAMEENFKDGITNGAKWYDVPGKTMHIKFGFIDFDIVVESGRYELESIFRVHPGLILYCMCHMDISEPSHLLL